MEQKKEKRFYTNRNIRYESYFEGDAFIIKHYNDDPKNTLKQQITKTNDHTEIKHSTPNAILSKKENFVGDKRHGIETRYFIPKANESIKSTKSYDNGKLHGECVTYNDKDKIVKQEVYALGKVALKYERADSDTNEIIGVEIVDQASVEMLPKKELERSHGFMSSDTARFRK